MEVRETRDVESTALYRGFGDTLARAFELVLTPMVFGLLGWLMDRQIGTAPLFALILGVVALAGVTVRMYYTYQLDMERHERDATWARRGTR